MKAVSCEEARLEVVDLPSPRPGKGQVLIEVLRCGICGSDLHARHHCDELADVMAGAGYDGFMRSHQQVVFGHEFCGEIAEYGPGCRRKEPTGTPVVALPLRRRGGDVHGIGLSAAAPGAYAEQLVVEESLMLPVPNGLPPELGGADRADGGRPACRPPRRGAASDDVAIVIGCGPIGLAVILHAQGPRRPHGRRQRLLGRAAGARDGLRRRRRRRPRGGLAVRGRRRPRPPEHGARPRWSSPSATMEKLRRAARALAPRLARRRAARRRARSSPVIFECVGVPGVIDEIIASAPLFSRVVVVGVCMGADRIRPAMAINKEIDLRFVVGYTPLEFRDTLHMLAEGKVDPRRSSPASVGLPGVETAFDALGDPEAHAKILIDPRSEAVET